MPFCHHKAAKLTQNDVSITYPCYKLFVPLSINGDYHLKVLKLVDVLQCVAVDLECTLPCVLERHEGHIIPRSC